ncbi:hypothetical protein PtA15_4A837 [Puccinia triticina]|uniref:Uncharacterized protein n=1 Tax=Puccinia triticina TaxID=208348 RepID=A0ABY7CI81_9BASI|nr:uncharacterized protein PtA15_4A837 [Puccinia triticina]WAQ84384.1 hypothetical protein PtA15_4A837 [Puccinia triticina]
MQPPAEVHITGQLIAGPASPGPQREILALIAPPNNNALRLDDDPVVFTPTQRLYADLGLEPVSKHLLTCY